MFLFLVDGDKVVRIQARRESELKLSEFMKFAMNKKRKKKLLMMMRVCTRAGLEKWQAGRRAVAGNSPRSNGKLGVGRENKNVMYRVAEFSFAGKSLFVLFLALFYDEKLFVNHSRILSTRLSWCLDRINRAHQHNSAGAFTLCGSFSSLAWQPRAISVPSLSQSYDTRKKYSIAIKTLANNFFFVERSRIEKIFSVQAFQVRW